MDAYLDPSRDPSEGDPLDESTFPSAEAGGASPSGGDFLGLGQGLDAHLGGELGDDEDYEYSDEEQAASWLFTLDEDSESAEAPAEAAGWVEDPAGALAAPTEGLQPGSAIGPDAWDPSGAAAPATVSFDDGSFDGGDEGEHAHAAAAYADDGLDGPSTLDASWTEPDSSGGFLRRHAVRVAAAVVVLGVGFAGWQLYGVGGDLTSSPETEVLAPEQNKTPGYAPRLHSPDGESGAPSNRRAVRGEGAETGVELAGGAAEGIELELPPAEQPVAVERVARSQPRPSARARWRSLLGMDAAGGDTLLTALPNLGGGPVGPRTGPRGEAGGGPALLRRSGRLETDFVDVPTFPNLRLATSEDLENVWPGFEIPVDEYGRPERLLTPYVGDVRAVLDSGDIFEGRLYAVGENRIWVTTGWGVVALETARLDAVVHVAPAGGELAQSDASPITRMPRIRVEAEGGGFPARLLYQDDRGATVVTDGGTRITVRPSDVDLVGLTPPVLLGQEPLR